jgi:hypothetical protein
MPATSQQLYDGLYRLGNEDRIDQIFPSVISKLTEFGMVEKESTPPRLTEYGHKCYRIMESGDDAVRELDDLAHQEYEQDLSQGKSSTNR